MDCISRITTRASDAGRVLQPVSAQQNRDPEITVAWVHLALLLPPKSQDGENAEFRHFSVLQMRNFRYILPI
ncbi:hypothetical protein [Calothrix sp. PCC 7507]|uniref:hypothetical protein n=1 Tax=Calothrix sp. PCC 7507 TaxID=99598 RepID=UPI0002E87439|nr:hypothetical protein [Calothrix sp. PCC 7507]